MKKEYIPILTLALILGYFIADTEHEERKLSRLLAEANQKLAVLENRSEHMEAFKSSQMDFNRDVEKTHTGFIGLFRSQGELNSQIAKTIWGPEPYENKLR